MSQTKRNAKISISINNGEGNVIMEGSKLEIISELAVMLSRNPVLPELLSEALILSKMMNKQNVKS